MYDSLWPHGLSPSGSSAHGISQARILEWVAILFSRGMNTFSCYFFFHDLVNPSTGNSFCCEHSRIQKTRSQPTRGPQGGQEAIPAAQLLQNDKAKGRGNNTESGVWRVCGQGDSTNQGENQIKVVMILPPIWTCCLALGCSYLSSTFSSSTMSSSVSNWRLIVLFIFLF